MNSHPALKLSAQAMLAGMAAGRWTSLELVEEHIAQIRQVNPAINAVVFERYELARAEAQAADQRRKAGGQLPALLGVPCTIKENFEFTGTPQASGLVSRKRIINQQDAPTVARLRAAGAIPLGVTNTPELCMWMETHNRVYGRTGNPYDPRRIAGGSSGGEGAIIGAGGSPFGLGADVGGSIRMPAFFNGVFGHKPTPGIVPNTGQMPLPVGDVGRYCVTGPLCRRAEDLMPVLRVLAGPDGADPHCQNFELQNPDELELSGRRLLVITGNGRQRVSRSLQAAQQRAAKALAPLFDDCQTVELYLLRHSFEIWSAAMAAAESSSFSERLGGGQPVSVLHELRRWGLRRSAHTLPALALAGLEKLPMPKKYLQMLDTLRSQILELLADDNVLLFPPYTRSAPRHNAPMLTPFDWVYTGILNVLELPSTQVPLGLDARGLPTGVQVVSAPGNDALCIRVAQELERSCGGWVPPWEARRG